MVWKNSDSSAQISLDYLIGVTIFLLAFLFVFAFIPGMFTPFNSNSDEVTMSADRVAATLVENVLVVGGPTTKEPCILDAATINQFKTDIESNPTTSKLVRQKMGLNRSDSGSLYDLQVVIQKEDGSEIDVQSSDTLGGTNVGQSKRYVLVRDSTAILGTIDNYPGQSAIVIVRVW